MPSPLGHSLMGCIIYKAMTRPVDLHGWQHIILYLFVANAPDLDFIPGFLVGDPNRYHHGISHSIGVAILFASALSFFLYFLKIDSLRRNFAIFFLLYFSHIILDYLSIDTGLPYGEIFFWPLSNEYYIAPFAFLPDIKRASSGSEFIPSLFSLHNLWAVSVEAILLLPILLLVLLLRRRSIDLTEKV